ncbi:MAG: hypothetical protein CL489_07995 [Acidobacteria bacterium]|jgi:hypothetical protein|nr:hypothetical protein [Acidobacteriota bacterium]
MQLYSIPIEIERVLDDPTLTDEERATALEALNYDFDDKVEAIVKFYQKEEADLAHIQGEINRLNRMKKTISTRQEWRKHYLKGNMLSADRRKAGTLLFGATLTLNSLPTVSVTDIDVVPQDFIEVTTTKKVIKKNIIDYLKETGEVPDGIDVQVDSHVRISTANIEENNRETS